MTLSLDDFKNDAPWHDDMTALAPFEIDGQIDGVQLQRLVTHGDTRGDLTVMLSTAYGDFAPLPGHIYLVNAAAGSVRAWVYHKHQSDRLAFANGEFKVVLYDLRKESPTYGTLNTLELGEKNKVLLTIPPFVVHGVKNVGRETAFFVNMPTRAYDAKNPDKHRIPHDHPDMPYHFD